MTYPSLTDNFNLETWNANFKELKDAQDNVPLKTLMFYPDNQFGSIVSTDLDAITTSGFYTCASSATNAPFTTASAFIYHHQANAATDAWQRATSYVDGSEKIRYKRAGSWTSWIDFVAGDMLASVYATNGEAGLVDRANRLREYNVQSSGASYNGQWTKVMSFEATKTYSGVSIILSIVDAHAYGESFLSVSFRTSSPMTKVASIGLKGIVLNSRFSENIPNSFKLVYTAPLFELWFNPSLTYLSPVFSILSETKTNTADTANVIWYENQPYQSETPSGTVVTATLMDDYFISDMTAETAIADTDYLPMYDASASANRKTLWSTIKSTLKTYFDTLYNLYVLPNATDSVLGGVKKGSRVTITDGVISADITTKSYSNISVLTSAWATNPKSLTGEAALYTAGYVYRAPVTCSGMSTSYYSLVEFGAAEAVGGNYAPISIEGTDLVYIYAKTAPSATITVASVQGILKGA